MPSNYGINDCKHINSIYESCLWIKGTGIMGIPPSVQSKLDQLELERLDYFGYLVNYCHHRFHI